MSTHRAFGPGKVILLGEHAVVYGHPAVAAPLSRGVRAFGSDASQISLELPTELEPAQAHALERAFQVAARTARNPKLAVSLSSDLPVSMGLGSSGALSVAIARLLLEARGKPASAAAVEALAFRMEKEFHGTPSGVDHTTSARGAAVLFQKGRARTLKAPRPVRVLVALVGLRPSTKLTVGALRARQAQWPKRYQRIFAEVGRLARDGAAAIEAGDLAGLGDCMNLNQGLLSALQLSGERIDAMVHTLRKHGALGAKLTGAGGDGGAVIGLFTEPEPIVARLLAQGITCFTSQLAGPQTL